MRLRDFLSVGRTLFLAGLVFIHLILKVGTAQSAQFTYMDVDGTALHDSGLNSNGKLPGFWSYWKLPRLRHLNNGWALTSFEELKKEKKLPEFVLVTRDEYDHFRSNLAKGEETPGILEPKSLTQDPLGPRGLEGYEGDRPAEFYAGFYWVNPSISWIYHDSNDRGERYFVRDIINAIERSRIDPRYEWRGEAFRFLPKILREQSKTSRLYFLTDRNIDQDELSEALMTMHKQGFIPDPSYKSPESDEIRFPKLVSTSSPTGVNFGVLADFASRKANFLENEASRIARSTLELHDTVSPDPNEAADGIRRKMHEMIVYENDPEYVRQIAVRLRKLAGEYPTIKFVLFHAAADIEKVRGADFNRGVEEWSRWTIFTPSEKGWRPPTDRELKYLEPKVRSAPASAPVSLATATAAVPPVCEAVLAAASGATANVPKGEVGK